jgi:L-fuculose-phosphate aldolase
LYDQAKISGIFRDALAECLQLSERSRNNASNAEQLFHSAKSRVIKQEIIEAGRKLWHRQYVDGNGGNISFRISPDYVICTPTLCSKADLCSDDLSLVDLNNQQICGVRPQTSEILLHLEIYKTLPDARAVIHCHPPYATAHAIAGMPPPQNLIPEQEVFVGPVALAPYETPGTLEFAQTVVPFVRKHNTILLANHGVVCWADTVTHAEWYIEVVDTYCKTALIASQLSPVLNEIPPHKIRELLAIKKRLGLPDARFESESDNTPRRVDDSTTTCWEESDSHACSGKEPSTALPSELESLLDRLTTQVIEHLGCRK